MSTLLDQASLVLIPSGYKEDIVYSQIPTDGSGDLSFTRASNGTRINSAGLVENVPWNLVEQSNSFSTSPWSLVTGSLTSGQTGYDGGSNGWLLTRTGTSGYLEQSIAIPDNGIIFIYAKAGTKNWFRLRATSTASASAFFDLSTGEVGSVANGSATIQSVGNGWYLCALTFAPTTSNVRLYVADADNDVSGSTGNVYIQNAQINIGSTAKPYFPTTDRLNVPRLTYQNGCPSLLLEKQSTNLVLYSEEFDNAYWVKDGSTATANAATSPDGTQNADKLFETAVTDFHRIYGSTISVTSGTAYTASIFVKAAEVTTFAIELRLTASVGTAVFDLVAETATGGGIIENYGNGWYRCIFTATATATGNGRPFFYMKQASSYAGNASNGILIWGAQFE